MTSNPNIMSMGMKESSDFYGNTEKNKTDNLRINEIKELVLSESTNKITPSKKKSSELRKSRVVNMRQAKNSPTAPKDRPFSKTGHIADLHVSKSNDKILY
jgi:hypothetical protein